MIEVVALDGGTTTYDHEGGSYSVGDGDHLWIYGDPDDKGRTRNVAVHASGTWAIARRATA